jgi:hypothetical protein
MTKPSFIFPLVYTILCFAMNTYIGFLGNHSKRKKMINHFLKLETTFQQLSVYGQEF